MSAVRDLTAELGRIFKAAKDDGEIDCWSQRPDSFARLDANVRRALLGALEAGGAEAFKPFEHFSEEHYVRNLVYANQDFELLVLCWRPGQGSRVHNHANSHGWVTVLAGRVEETRYANPCLDDSLPPSPHQGPADPPALPGVLSATAPCPPLAETGRVVGGPGAQLYINDSMALHAVRCADDTTYEAGAVTLHLYAPPVRKVRLYEPEADRVVVRVPGYHTKPEAPESRLD